MKKEWFLKPPQFWELRGSYVDALLLKDSLSAAHGPSTLHPEVLPQSEVQ